MLHRACLPPQQREVSPRRNGVGCGSTVVTSNRPPDISVERRRALADARRARPDREAYDASVTMTGGGALTDLDEVIERYHQALNEFARGDPASVKALYAHADDITLANPFVGPPAHGWTEVSAALDYASSKFRDGEMTSSERIAGYVT